MIDYGEKKKIFHTILHTWTF